VVDEVKADNTACSIKSAHLRMTKRAAETFMTCKGVGQGVKASMQGPANACFSLLDVKAAIS
jgi:hypothetical protein